MDERSGSDGADGMGCAAAADEQIERIAALADPVRRALYRFVAAQPGAVSRDDAAAGAGVPYHVAKFHLDRLADEGLLDVEFRRPPGRTGPGAGRPAKLYRRSAVTVAVSVPERRYELAGRVFARAITDACASEVPLPRGVHESARAIGRELAATIGPDHATGRGPGRAAAGGPGRAAAGGQAGAAAPRHSRTTAMGRGRQLAAAAGLLAELGYEPRVERSSITLANCPFHQLASDYTELVCGMNVALIDGIIAGLDLPALQAQLAPVPGQCCVRITAARSAAGPR